MRHRPLSRACRLCPLYATDSNYACCQHARATSVCGFKLLVFEALLERPHTLAALGIRITGVGGVGVLVLRVARPCCQRCFVWQLSVCLAQARRLRVPRPTWFVSWMQRAALPSCIQVHIIMCKSGKILVAHSCMVIKVTNSGTSCSLISGMSSSRGVGNI